MIFASNSILSSTRVLGTRSTISIKELLGVSARIGLTVCAILASLAAHYLLTGTARPGLASWTKADCDATSVPSCRLERQQLGAGRWRLIVKGHQGAPVRIMMDLQGDPPQAKVLLVRGGYDY